VSGNDEEYRRAVDDSTHFFDLPDDDKDRREPKQLHFLKKVVTWLLGIAGLVVVSLFTVPGSHKQVAKKYGAMKTYAVGIYSDAREWTSRLFELGGL
jgi:hypothetical protein